MKKVGRLARDIEQKVWGGGGGGGGKRANMRQKREDKEKIKCFMKGADQSVGTTDE